MKISKQVLIFLGLPAALLLGSACSDKDVNRAYELPTGGNGNGNGSGGNGSTCDPVALVQPAAGLKAKVATFKGGYIPATIDAFWNVDSRTKDLTAKASETLTPEFSIPYVDVLNREISIWGFPISYEKEFRGMKPETRILRQPDGTPLIENFSVSYEGVLKLAADENPKCIRFAASSDDGVEMLVENKSTGEMVNYFKKDGAFPETMVCPAATDIICLDRNTEVKFRLTYYQNLLGGASISLLEQLVGNIVNGQLQLADASSSTTATSLQVATLSVRPPVRDPIRPIDRVCLMNEMESIQEVVDSDLMSPITLGTRAECSSPPAVQYPDVLCNRGGMDLFHDGQTLAPTSNYQALLSRGWTVAPAKRFQQDFTKVCPAK